MNNLQSRSAKGSGTMQRRSNGSYEYIMTIHYLNGVKKRKSFYGKSKAQAIRKYKEYMQNIAIMPSFNTDITVEKYLLQYFLPYKIQTLKSSSYKRLYKTIKYQVIPILGQIKMQKLTKYNIQDMQNELKLKGESISSQKKAYDAINGACKFALGELLMTNPCAQIRAPRKETGSAAHTIVFLDTNEIKIFKEELFRTYPNGIPLYGKNRWTLLLQLQTGLRPGEICGIQLKDIKFDDRQRPVFIHVQHIAIDPQDEISNFIAKSPAMIQNSVKTAHSNRHVPLNPEAQEAIYHLMKINHVKNSNDLLITNKFNKVLAPRYLTKTYNSVIDGTHGKIPPSKKGAHTLRRTFATQLFERKINIKTISYLLGHSSIVTTLDWYVGLSEKKKLSEIEKFDNI